MTPTLIKHESPAGPFWRHPDHPDCQDGKVLWEEPSDTPRTDAFMETLQGYSDSWETFAQKVEDFSCDLERKLNAASEIVHRLAEWSEKYPRQQVHSFSAKVDEQLIEIENAAKAWRDGHNIDQGQQRAEQT